MRWYIAHSYEHRQELTPLINQLVRILENRGHQAFVFTREYQNFERGEEKQMMQAACDEMDASDALIAEVSSKEIGVGIEVGYMRAQHKPIIYLRQKAAHPSTTVSGLSTYAIVYDSAGDAIEQLQATGLL